MFYLNSYEKLIFISYIMFVIRNFNERRRLWHFWLLLLSFVTRAAHVAALHAGTRWWRHRKGGPRWARAHIENYRIPLWTPLNLNKLYKDLGGFKVTVRFWIGIFFASTKNYRDYLNDLGLSYWSTLSFSYLLVTVFLNYFSFKNIFLLLFLTILYNCELNYKYLTSSLYIFI